MDEEELENESETDYQDGFCSIVSCSPQTVHPETIIDVPRRRSSLICDIYGVNVNTTCIHAIRVYVIIKHTKRY